MALSIKTKRALVTQAMQTPEGRAILKNVIGQWMEGEISQPLCDAIDNGPSKEMTSQMIDGVLDAHNQGKIDKTRASQLVADIVEIEKEM